MSEEEVCEVCGGMVLADLTSDGLDGSGDSACNQN
jgi:hypothetical protein